MAEFRSLRDLLQDVHDNEIDKGWKPNDNTFGDSIALLHTEVSEAFDTYRDIGFQYRDTENIKDGHISLKPDDVASELVDVLVRLLSTWDQFMLPRGFDLESEFKRKMKYNKSRSYRHGGKRI
jgi:NTP pyrophosphatase (non-canonical NTP hydrolase)